MNRREFLRAAGLGLAAATMELPRPGFAEAAGAAEAPSHFVPVDKGLKPEWIRSLFARGSKEVFRGAELRFIGMPVGGIGTGQLYLCGDGTLGNWEIFNRYEYLGTGELNYTPRSPAKPVDQGFAVVVEHAGNSVLRGLNAKEFPEVEFSGQYPVAQVRYKDVTFPVEVELEAFSPFIPLNAKDSALPATIFTIKVTNRLNQPVRIRSLGWLENVVCIRSAQDVSGAWRTRWLKGKGRTLMCHGAEATPAPATTDQRRPPIILQDFEGADYGKWQTTGEAFGTGPASGKLEPWQEVKGFEGKGLVNSYRRGDSTTGTLVSPEFTIERKYINFLVGGGHFPASPAGVELVTLKIDGRVVMSTTGENDEQLRWETWDVSQYDGKSARIEVVDTRPYFGGHILVDQIEMSDEKRRKPAGSFNTLVDFGSMTLALKGESDEPAVPELVQLLAAPVNKEFHNTTEAYAFPNRRNAALASHRVELAAGGSHMFTFVLAWHFPHAKQGHEYSTRFTDAPAVANYVLNNLDRLAGGTRRWRDTYYDSTLPYWLLDRLHSTVSTLATGTSQWWANGRFWAWEGVVSCPGTCTHVWNYAQGEARLFPELARSVRELQDFSTEGGGFHPETGMVGFRSDHQYAADGQCGTVLKAYREHLVSPGPAFLKRNWPKIRQALEFCIRQDGQGSPAEDGLIENSQPNTYDIAFEGANTFVGSLYLAALRAGEEMAREMGDTALAERTRRIFERGRAQSVERLWNGEYFIQDVDLAKHPANQYGPGCLSDQLFGQSWAHQVGLGYLYPEINVKQALASVWKYNWAPDVAPQLAAHPALRSFALPGDGGLFIVTWPKSSYLKASILYKNEVWTGIEYQVAAHMIWEGQVEQGLAICRAIHERYRPARRNPYNEVECGDHYARGLASWGVFTALCGFEYHGPRGHIGFAPRITPEDFKAAFTGAEGWGAFTQKQEGNVQREKLEVIWGRVAVKTLAFEAIGDLRPTRVAVTLNGESVAAALRVEERRLLIVLNAHRTIAASQVLEVKLS
jgi:non-lysosomal glucosylceramidase